MLINGLDVKLTPLTTICVLGVMLLLGLQLTIVVLKSQHQRQIKQAHKQLQEYARELEALAAIKERNRFAHEFYDGLGQSLAALNIQLQTANKLLHIDLEEAQRFLAQAHQLGCSTMQEVRQVVKTLGKDAKLPSHTSLPSLDCYLGCTHPDSESGFIRDEEISKPVFDVDKRFTRAP